tara:strand:+ start:673 stop:1008 length:336 start_codon:yes stop_codon:yes gene_type:complete
MINMTDGSKVSIEGAALAILKEKELCSGLCRVRDDGTYVRDAIGVIENHTWNGERCVPERTIKHEQFRVAVATHNDTQPREIGYKNDVKSCQSRSREMSRYLFSRWKWPNY